MWRNSEIIVVTPISYLIIPVYSRGMIASEHTTFAHVP